MPVLDQQQAQVVTEPDWSSSLVATFGKELAPYISDVPQVHSVTATSPEEVEIIFSDPTGRPGLRGIRLNSDQVRAAGWRVRTATASNLAFDIVHMGIGEPRALEEFSPPDADGVRWLDIPQWLAEIS